MKPWGEKVGDNRPRGYVRRSTRGKQAQQLQILEGGDEHGDAALILLLVLSPRLVA